MRPSPALTAGLFALVLSCGAKPGPTVGPTPTTSADAAKPQGPCDASRRERARVPGLLAEGKLDRARRVLRRANDLSKDLCPTDEKDTWDEEVSTLAELCAWSDVRPLAEKILADGGASTDAKAAATAALDRARSLDVAFAVTDEAKAPMRAKYREAQARSDAGDAKGARDLYVEAWHLWRPNGQALVQAGLEARKLGDPVDAQKLFDRGLDELERANGAQVKVDVPNGLLSDFVDWSSRGRIALNDGTGLTIVAQHSLAEVLRIDGIRAGFFSPDGRTVLGFRPAGPLTLWDASSGEEVRTFAGTDRELHDVAFSADGNRLAVSVDSEVRLFEVASGKLLSTLDVSEWDVSIQLTSDGRTLMVASQSAVRFWSCDTGKEIRTLRTGAYDFWTARLSPDAKTVAVVGKAGNALLDAATGRELRKLDPHPSRYEPTRPARVSGFTFSPGGDLVMSTSWDQDDTIVWQVATGHVQSSLAADTVAERTPAHFSQDGKLIAVGGMALRIHDALTGKELRRSVFHAGAVRASTFARDGKRLAVAANAPLRVWDLERGEVRAAPDARNLEAVAFAHTSDELMGVTAEGAVSFLDTDLRRVRTLAGAGESANDAALAPDDSLVALGVRRSTPLLVVAGPAAVAPALENATGNESCDEVVFAPKGRSLAAACSKRLVVWDVASGRVVHDVESPSYLYGLAASPDDRWLAAMQDDGVHLWDRSALDAPPRLLHAFTPSGSRTSGAITFSSDSASVAASYGDGELAAWSIPEGKELFHGRADRFGVASIEFSPDGSLLVAGGRGGSTNLFRGPSFEPIATLRGLTDADAAYVLSNDGHLEVFGGEPDKARAFALCRIGAVTFELAVCAERLETRGLLKALTAGDESYRAP